MDLLAPPSAQGLPAAFELLVTLKVIGFALHMGPMHLWYAGLPLAAILSGRSSHARRLSRRLGGAIPTAIALGINFGLVPLLFTQVLYHRAVYPAGILMAWPWLAVIPCLVIAYGCTYVHAFQAKSGNVGRSGRVALVVAAVLIVLLGFLFTNHFSLLTNLSGWKAIAERTSVSGAVSGLALNTGDPSLWPRWLTMFGLAVTTTAVWIAVDTVLLRGGDEDPAYRAWALRCALATFALGAVAAAAAGTWYTLGTLSEETLIATRGTLGAPFLVAATVAPLPVGVLLWRLSKHSSRPCAWGLVAAQSVVLLLGAVVRQVVQHQRLAGFGYDPSTEAVRAELSPLIVFGLSVAVGVGVIVWMLRAVARDLRNPT
jgi:hypothetical protein